MGVADADTTEKATEDEETPVREEPVENMTIIVRAEVLQKVVEQLLTIVDEAIFRLGHRGLSVAAVDPANVAMVDVDVDPGAFESVGDGMFPIGVNLKKLDDYIDGASGADPITLSYAPNKRSMQIQHTNVEVEMAGINPDAIRSEPDVPDLEHSAEFGVDAKVLHDAVKNADLVTDHVRFEADVDEGALVVSGQGDVDEIQTVIGDDELADANFDEEVTSLFSQEYLTGGGILTPLSSGTEVTGLLDQEMPIFLNYEFADGYGSVEMMLAPRIQSN